jgi:hypothetical protein
VTFAEIVAQALYAAMVLQWRTIVPICGRELGNAAAYDLQYMCLGYKIGYHTGMLGNRTRVVYYPGSVSHCDGI